MADDTEYIKLPLLQRCSHKLWKARVHGYTEAAKLFQEEDEKSPVFGQYVTLVPKFVSDTHAAAQEKGLEATLYFIQNSSVAGKTVRDVMSAIIAKSIAAPKKSTQDLSVQITLMYIEIEKQESVIEELVKGLDHKNPKIVAACITTLTTSLKEFGSQVVSIKPLIKPVLTLIEDRDKTVRDETKNLVVEIYRWIGEAIKPQLTKLKPIQLTELEAEFAKVKGEKAVPSRYLRSQQERQAKAVGNTNDEVDEGTVAVAEAEVDPLSLIDPINVLAKLPNNFYEQIEAAKWQDRKQALENLEEILNHPKFEKGEYGDIVRALMKIVTKDSNVVVVGVATKCIARLAAGLKKNFHPYASATLPQLLAKFKEKKANVVTPLREAVDALFPSTNLEAIMEDVIASLDNKNPSIKAETAAFLGRCFAQSSPTALNKKILKTFAAALLKTLNEPDPGVRDSSAEAIGIAMKVVGEKNIMPFLPDIDPLKLAKIKECCEKAVVKTVAVVKVREPAAVQAKPKKVERPVKEPVQVKKPVVEEDIFEEEKVEEKKSGRIDISPKITDQLLAELADKNWKVRNDALLSIQAMLTDTKIKPNLGDLPGVLIQRFVDSNSKLIVTALEICTALALALGPGSKNYVRTFARGIFNALGDNKQWVRGAASTCLNAWVAEAGAKEFFSGEIIPDVLKTSSVALKIEVWTWLAEILPSVKGLPKDELCLMIPCLFSALEDRNPDIRKAGNNAVYGLMIHVGYYNMSKEAEKLKPASKAGIIAILDKIRPDVPELEPKAGAKQKIEMKGKSPAPKSAPAKKARASLGPSVAKAVPRKKEDEVDTSPLLLINKMKNQRVLDEQKLKILKWNFTSPRPEFVELLKEQMTSAGFNKNLVANMFHADFKFHIKAIESLMDDLHNEEALTANLDLILKWMTLRFFDTNPSVLLKGLEYVQSAFNILIEKEYTMFDVEANAFIPYLVMKVGDPKDAVRDRVHAILKQFSKMFAPGKLFLHIMDGLKSKNSRLRTECLDELGFLIESFGTSVCMPSSTVALKEISKQISDRDNSVRSAALNAIVQAFFVDGDKIYKQIGRLSDKDMSYLEERIKRSSQNRTKVAHEVSRVPTNDNKAEPEVEDYDEPMDEPEPEFEKEPSPEPLPPVLQKPYKTFSGIASPRVAKLDLVDIDDSFLNEPILIPESIYQKMQQKTPPNPPLEAIFKNVSGDNIPLAIEGAKKLHAVMQSDVGDKLQPFSRGIFDALICQLQKANSYSAATHGSDLGQLYKTLFRNIDDIFSKKTPIGLSGDEEQLKSLVRELLIALVDEKTKLFQGSDLNQWIIVFVANIIENSDTTNITCASINALYDLVGNPPTNPKLTDLSVKCVLKIIVIIKKANDLDAIVNLDRILYTCHLFMQTYPRHTWKDRPSDVPLKAIKTLLMNLVLKKGIAILTHLRSIENPISSEVAIYLKKMIKQQPTTAKSTKLTKETSDHLSEIFKKIASEGNGNEGLVQLYEFKKEHPEVDLSAILAPTTQFFKEYVSEGLKQIEKERGPLKQISEPTATLVEKMDNVSIDPPNPPSDFKELPQYYLEKLRQYQQRLGYPVSNLPDFKPFDANSNSE